MNVHVCTYTVYMHVSIIHTCICMIYECTYTYALCHVYTYTLCHVYLSMYIPFYLSVYLSNYKEID